jgi:hypothetical protein
VFPVPLIAGYIAAPVLLISGWLRWHNKPHEPGFAAKLSLVGFSIGTASALLALGSIGWATACGEFGYYDPALMRIFAAGLMISVAGLLTSLGGLVRANPLRWHAPALCLTMATLWLMWAAME